MALMLFVGIAVVAVALLFALWPRNPRIDITSFPQKYKEEKGDRPHYDVIVVGAGPSGATLAYYLSKLGRKVLLLEKKEFPRDKICGDALVKTAIEILKDMGVLDKLMKEKRAHVSDAGGLVSPSGLSYIGKSHHVFGEIPGAIGCKRIYLDEAIATAAKEAGADLKENSSVDEAKFDSDKGLWTVTLDNSDVTYQGRVLVCADGATSRLAGKLGMVTQAPQGSCSRCYIEGGSHKFKADGVIFYHRGFLPGYACLFKHPNDDINYCCYLIPGNPKVTNDDLTYWHEHIMKNDASVSRALGKNVKSERMKAGSLRIGGEEVTYGDHVIVVGDAAGFIDPMTGEGIHHAMDSGKLAAHFLDEAFKVGNFSKAVMAEYQNRWMNKFGLDFKWSMWLCWAGYKWPILLDAFAAAVMRKGDQYLARWADIMTGRIPKWHLLRPDFVIVLTFELTKLALQRMLGTAPKSEVPAGIVKKMN